MAFAKLEGFGIQEGILLYRCSIAFCQHLTHLYKLTCSQVIVSLCQFQFIAHYGSFVSGAPPGQYIFTSSFLYGKVEQGYCRLNNCNAGSSLRTTSIAVGISVRQSMG